MRERSRVCARGYWECAAGPKVKSCGVEAGTRSRGAHTRIPATVRLESIRGRELGRYRYGGTRDHKLLEWLVRLTTDTKDWRNLEVRLRFLICSVQVNGRAGRQRQDA